MGKKVLDFHFIFYSGNWTLKRTNFFNIFRVTSVTNKQFPYVTALHGELWEKNILLRYQQITEDLEVIIMQFGLMIFLSFLLSSGDIL